MYEIELNSNFSNALLSNSKNYENTGIDVIDKNIKYGNFFENYLMKNLPCIIKNVSGHWECSRRWRIDNEIDYDYLTNVYGDLEAPVADCSELNSNTHCKVNMTVKNYMNYMKHKTDKLQYLKDWHLKRNRPNDNFYEIPIMFASDWLNEFSDDKTEDDYKFVYIGPKDSWTPLHADVYSSYSWSVNVVGRKKWTLFPPGEENKLKDKFGNIPTKFVNELYTDVKYYEIIQETGDAIFVPSGWFHQVFNLLDTISINHNWINGCNVEIVLDALESNLINVQNEIKEFSDTENFEPHCQLMLKSIFGMDYKVFVEFINHIGNKRLRELVSDSHKGLADCYLGIKHIKFDLYVILKILIKLCNHPIINNEEIIPLHLKHETHVLKQNLSLLSL
ncbi:hypothetical protein ACJJTC_011964 [Scirpophaga incertulas]